MRNVDILSYLALLAMISAPQATQRIPAAARKRRARVLGDPEESRALVVGAEHRVRRPPATTMRRIVLHVALNTLTNYVNTVAGTEIDFPVVQHRAK